MKTYAKYCADCGRFITARAETPPPYSECLDCQRDKPQRDSPVEFAGGSRAYLDEMRELREALAAVQSTVNEIRDRC